jgi:tRNA threonylcarbamoyladenosine biosynthesis protein TsaE
VPLYHFDLYRLRSPKEFLDAGFSDFLTSGIACIEWPEHALPFLPKNTLHLSFTHVDLHTRKIQIKGLL